MIFVLVSRNNEGLLGQWAERSGRSVQIGCWTELGSRESARQTSPPRLKICIFGPR